eukprot:5853885-Amphidinium_carterae.1
MGVWNTKEFFNELTTTLWLTTLLAHAAARAGLLSIRPCLVTRSENYLLLMLQCSCGAPILPCKRMDHVFRAPSLPVQKAMKVKPLRQMVCCVLPRISCPSGDAKMWAI